MSFWVLVLWGGQDLGALLRRSGVSVVF